MFQAQLMLFLLWNQISLQEALVDFNGDWHLEDWHFNGDLGTRWVIASRMSLFLASQWTEQGNRCMFTRAHIHMNSSLPPFQLSFLSSLSLPTIVI